MLINRYQNRKNLPGILEGTVEFSYNPTDVCKDMLIYPEYLGDMYCGTDYCLSRSGYCDYCMMHLLSGKAAVHTGDRDYVVEEGQTFLIRTAKPHIYGCIDPMHTLWIHFTGTGSDGIFDYLIAKNHNSHVFSLNKDSDYVNKLWKFINFFSENKPGSELEISRRLYEVIGLLGIDGGKAGVSQIGGVVRYISRNYAEPIGLEDMAKMARLSVSRFSEIFKEEMGCSPYKYVINTRLRAACRLLSGSKMSVGQIAEVVGFGSTTPFIYSFRRKYGITPKQYVLKNKNQNGA